MAAVLLSVIGWVSVIVAPDRYEVTTPGFMSIPDQC